MNSKSTFNKTSLATSIALSGALLMAATQAHAGWAGGQTATVAGHENIEVGVSTVSAGTVHTPGLAGIGVSTYPTYGTSQKIDFDGISAFSGSGPRYTLSAPITSAPSTHNNLGVFTFMQVGTSDVWYGEWSENGATVVDGTTYNGRQVYYSGMNADNTIPGSQFSPVTASYFVEGVNSVSNPIGVLFGQFDATFRGTYGTLTGQIGAFGHHVIDIGTANISANAQISGTGVVATTVSGGSTLASGGTIEGQFYNGHTGIAGLIDFNGTVYDTAFGGTKIVP